MSAAGAAIELHEELKVDTEFWISGGRLEGGGNTIINSVKAMTVNIPGFTLKELGWATWPQFRDVVCYDGSETQVRLVQSHSFSSFSSHESNASRHEDDKHSVLPTKLFCLGKT